MKKKLLSGVIILALVIMIAVSTTPTTPITNTDKEPVKFIISSWDFDNGYGEGIECIFTHENSTGAWVGLRWPTFTFWYEDTVFDLNYTENTAIRIWPCVNLNHTLRGLTENATGYNIMRVGIEFWTNGNLTFSQQNLTWDSAVYDDSPTVWAYGCWVTIPILIEAGAIYTATITYEIYEVVT